jgi:hypothetical protein
MWISPSSAILSEAEAGEFLAAGLGEAELRSSGGAEARLLLSCSASAKEGNRGSLCGELAAGNGGVLADARAALRDVKSSLDLLSESI